MRTYLFRGKCVGTGEWVEGSLVKYEHDNIAHIIFTAGFESFNGESTEYDEVEKRIEVLHETVGQFTGLFGKGSVKIWEGDIEMAADGKCSVFVWHFNRWVLRDTKTGKMQEINKMWVDYAKYKIIGNIHDQPELCSK